MVPYYHRNQYQYHYNIYNSVLLRLELSYNTDIMALNTNWNTNWNYIRYMELFDICNWYHLMNTDWNYRRRPQRNNFSCIGHVSICFLWRGYTAMILIVPQRKETPTAKLPRSQSVQVEHCSATFLITCNWDTQPFKLQELSLVSGYWTNLRLAA